MKSGSRWPLLDQDGVQTDASTLTNLGVGDPFPDVTGSAAVDPPGLPDALTPSMAPVSPIVMGGAPVSIASTSQSAFVIDVAYTSNVTGLQTSNPTLYAEYTNAVQAAVQYYESEFTNSLTVNITFDWAPLTGGASGQSNTDFGVYTYAQLYSAVTASETTSAVQRTAVATLPSTDPTSGSAFLIATPEARALGMTDANVSMDGTVTLDSSINTDFAWTRTSIAGNQEDAIGTLEHEISEVLGRSATSGAGGEYELLDMYRYTAADGGTDDAPGSSAGVRDEPFVAGYNVNASSYFSFDGTHVTLPFETPADVASGSDVADWDPTISGDSYADGPTGVADLVTPTDLNVMNVLGYDLACFAAGTLIQTVRGPIAVEQLAPGDHVATRDGPRPVVWVGSRRVDCARHPKPETVWPVRIAARTFDRAFPRRDLFLSPDHAVFVDGALIPVKLLINGTSIAQVRRDAVVYYHVELPEHAVILAEGLPVESYLDLGDRANFDDGETIRLYPDFARSDAALAWETRGAAPLVTAGEQLATARRAVKETVTPGRTGSLDTTSRAA